MNRPNMSDEGSRVNGQMERQEEVRMRELGFERVRLRTGEMGRQEMGMREAGFKRVNAPVVMGEWVCVDW